MGFDGYRFVACFKGLYRPGIQNDCILIDGGRPDRGDLSVLRRVIPTGSGIHKLLPNLKFPGKCVNVMPLKNSQESKVSFQFVCYCLLLAWKNLWPFILCMLNNKKLEKITLEPKNLSFNHSYSGSSLLLSNLAHFYSA